jgi:hypothetical protein
MATIILKHGTCACNLEKIKQNGLKARSYLTDDEPLAFYYAECAADECDCGDYDLVDVEVESEQLRVDFNSYEEPLSYFRNAYTTSDSEWFQMINDGTVPYPDSEYDYNTSIAVVRSVIHMGPISAANIIDA